MKPIIKLVLLSICIIFVLSACGPSEEAIATMTASVWTPTPEPTLTPTPVPYDLEVTLQDTDGNPVTQMAFVKVEETGEDMQPVDESGMVSYANLPGSDVTVSVMAQGYEQASESLVLDRGVNETVLSLEVDPIQIMPSNACQSGQEILIIEDFEDKQLQGWDGVVRPDWDFAEVEDRGIVATVKQTDQNQPPWINTQEEYGNFVWHLEMRRELGRAKAWLGFHQTDWESYYVHFHNINAMGLQHIMDPDGYDLGRLISLPAADGESWDKITIAYYEGVLDLYLNEKLVVGVTDESPAPEGRLAVNFETPDDITLALDNFVVCSLSEPYTPPVVEE